MKANKTCAVCGTRYAYCPGCVQDMNKPVWMNLFHAQECKDIYDVCSQFENNRINADKAAAKLAGLDLSKITSASIKNSVAKIKSSANRNDGSENKFEKSDKHDKFNKFEKREKKFSNDQNDQAKPEEVKEAKDNAPEVVSQTEEISKE